jgi:hypothetical protein
MIHNLLLSSPRKARDAALCDFAVAKCRGDTRTMKTALEALYHAQNNLLKAECRWGWVRV